MESVCKAGKPCGYASAFVFGMSVLAVQIPAQAAGEAAAQIRFRRSLSATSTLSRFVIRERPRNWQRRRLGSGTRILAAPASADAAAQWAKLDQACPTRGADTSYALFQSSLHAIHAQAGEAKFVILSGDLIAHSFSCKFAAVFPKATPADYKAFVEKTIAFDLANLRAALPGVPVYAALGNNDSDCGDYQLDANSAFLKEIGQDFAADFVGTEKAQALRDFAAGGYYSVTPACAC